MKKFATSLLSLSLIFANTPQTKASFAELLEEDTATVNITSWSGGGIRGLSSLYLAKAVDDHLGGGISLIDQVDWHFGTSTGGIIGLGLAKGLSIQHCIDIYEKNGGQIFRKDDWSVWRSIRSLWEETYTDTGLVDLLHTELGADTKFQDIGKGSTRGGPDVIVTSYDVWNGGHGKTPFLFNSRNPNLQTVDIWKAARATSAAPTYFDPCEKIAGRVLIDGGVYANDPGEAGLEDIKQFYPRGQNVNMLSFGTGVFNESLTAAEARNRGKLDWAVGISGLLMGASTQSIEHGLQKDLGHKQIKLDIVLDHEIALDATSPAELAELRDLALDFSKKNPREIDRAAHLIRR